MLKEVQGDFASSFVDSTSGLTTMSPTYRITARNPNGSAPAVVFPWN
jgi:hypothetical protein